MLPEIDVLLKFFQNFAQIPPTEWMYALRFIKSQKVPKGECWFHQNEMFHNIGFLVKGMIYSYYENKEGEMGVKRFTSAGVPLAPYPAIVTGKPANYSIKALEDSLIFYLAYSDFQKLLERHICWERILRKGLEQEIEYREIKEYELFMLSPEERYQSYLNEYKGHIDRIPQYLVASYIGVTPEALSRIRARIKGSE